VLITPHCPYGDAAVTLARSVCQHRGGLAEVRVVKVADEPAAERLRFLGSPTIRVEGRDIEPGAEWNVEVVHGCRLYQGPHTLHGLPEATDYQMGARVLLGGVSSADLATFVSVLDHVLDRLREAASTASG
jgi:hypothetical protein